MNLVASSDSTAEGRGMALAYIVSKGPKSIPAILALLSRSAAIPENLEREGPFLSPARERLLFEALLAWDSARVAEELQNLLRERPSLALRTLVIRILGKTGDARCIESFLQVIGGLGREELLHPSLRQPAIQSMAALLVRDSLSYVVLSVLIGELDPDLTLFAIEGIAKAGRADGVDLLERLLGHSPSYDERILEAFASLGLRDLARVAPDVRAIVRPYLRSAEASSRRAATRTIGALRDSTSILEIIDLLEDSDVGVASAALEALRLMAGTAWPAAPKRWTQWYQREELWARGPGQKHSEEIETGTPEAAVKAIRELSLHPLFGERITKALGDGSTHDSRDVAVLACEALSRMRIPEALNPLIEALYDPRDAVREAAANGLREVTGESLPANGSAWREWLEG